MPHSLPLRLSLALAFSLPGASALQAEPETLPSGNFLLWQPEQRPAGFSHMDRIFPTRVVKAGPHPRPLPKAPHELAVRYTVDGRPMDTTGFMAANHVAGLLVIKDGRIRIERYRLGLTAKGHWNSFSVAKSVTSTLVGAAIRDGYIQSLDDPIIRYIPGLKGSVYDGVTMRNMLTMSSGARWNENYEDPNSDEMKMKEIDGGKGGTPVDYMAHLPRIAPPGSQFHYSTGDADLIGIALANATGMSMADYLAKTIWQPFGMENDAYWVTSGGRETGGGGLSVSLRDFGRFGLFFMGGGMAGGRKVLPEGWVKDASALHLQTQATWADVGYGYQWWVWKDGTYRAIGIFGQMIYIDPASKLVIVTLSAWPHAVGQRYHDAEAAYIAAVRRAIG
ncbi:serine hydrolase [Novosphingobium sp.]|uniref:serine hydrolase domain-containing protein n=1 Tax=Novosphingobium sp. TaxID=1874826 RepID=UPI0031D49206